MKLDILLTHSEDQILIETKCVAQMTQAYHQGRPKLRSSHLYQLSTYLQHLEPGPPATGLLLYAQSGNPLRANLHLAGQPLHARSLDLGQPWPGIHRELLGLIDELAPAPR